MYKLTLIVAAGSMAMAAMAGGAQAQGYGPRPAYAAAGYDDGCRGGQFTLAGAHAGVTVLGIDVGASAGLHVGLHDRCRGGGRPAAYAPSPVEYGPPQGYGRQTAYGEVGYPAPPAYPQPAYGGGGGGYGYVYAGQATYGGRPPCGC